MNGSAPAEKPTSPTSFSPPCARSSAGTPSGRPEVVDLTGALTEALPGSETALPRPEDHVIVLFGATGDLARRKLLPGLYHLFEAGLLPKRWRIIGNSRTEW